MGYSADYSDVPLFEKGKSYQAGARVRVPGYVFEAAFWADQDPREVVDPSRQGWRLYDELYDETVPAGGPTTEAKIIGYIPSWRDEKDFDYQSPDLYRPLTHALLAFLTFREDALGEIDPRSAKIIVDLAVKIRPATSATHTRLVVSLGGANDYGFLALMTEAGRSISVSGIQRRFVEARGFRLLDRAARNVVRFVDQQGLDGVDLDLECWWSKSGDPGGDQGGRLRADGAHPAGYALTMFALMLGERFLAAGLRGKTISAAVFATSWYGNNYDALVASHLDWLGVMTYDLTGSWNNSPVGPHTALTKIRKPEQYLAEQQGGWPSARSGGSGRDPMSDNPIFSVEDALWYWSNPYYSNWQGRGQQVPRNKLVLGVPLYGYDFAYGKGPDDQSGLTPPGYAAVRYKDIVRQFPEAHLEPTANIKVPGSTPRPPFIAAPGAYPYAHNIYYETPKSAVEKLEFAKQRGAQGVLVWERSDDAREGKKSIVTALHENSGDTRASMFSKMMQLDAAWSNDVKIEGAGTSGSPALARFRDKLYCVHEGAGEEGWLRYFTIDLSGKFSSEGYLRADSGGEKVGASQPHARQWGRRAFHGPSAALVVFGDKLYCFSEQRGKTGKLQYVFTEDGNTWSSDVVLGGTGTSGAPGLCVHRGRLFCAHEGPGENGALVCKVFEPSLAKSTEETLETEISGPPSLVVMEDSVYCFYQGPGQNGVLTYRAYDDATQTWGDRYRIPDVTMSGSPAATMMNGKIYLFHEGPKKGAFQSTNRDAILYSTEGGVTAGLIGATPELIAFFGARAVTMTAFLSAGGTLIGGVLIGAAIGVAIGAFISAATNWAPGDGTLRWIGRTVEVDKKDPKGQLVKTWVDLAPMVQGRIVTSGPPAVAAFEGKLYCIHEGAGESGELHCLTRQLSGRTLEELAEHDVWAPIKGKNSYLQCHVSRGPLGERYVKTATLTVERGAPWLCATLTQDANTTAFPEGAKLQIEGPNGTAYDEKNTSGHVAAAMNGDSLRALVVESPAEGTWRVLLEVPPGTGFEFRFETLPSADVYATIRDTLVATLEQVKAISAPSLAMLLESTSWLGKTGWYGPSVLVALARNAEFVGLALEREPFIQLISRFAAWGADGDEEVKQMNTRSMTRKRKRDDERAARQAAADAELVCVEEELLTGARARASHGQLKTVRLDVGVWNIQRKWIPNGSLQGVVDGMLEDLDFLFLLEVLERHDFSMYPNALRHDCGGDGDENEDVVLLPGRRRPGTWQIVPRPDIDGLARQGASSYRYPISATATWTQDQRARLTLSGWHARPPGGDSGTTRNLQLKHFAANTRGEGAVILLSDLNMESMSDLNWDRKLNARTTLDELGRLSSKYDTVLVRTNNLGAGVRVVTERTGRYFAPTPLPPDDVNDGVDRVPFGAGGENEPKPIMVNGNVVAKTGAEFRRKLSDHLPVYFEIELEIDTAAQG